MIPPRERERQAARLQQLKDAFVVAQGLGPLDQVDEWLREALMKSPHVNHRIKPGGCLLQRTSAATQIKVMEWMFETWGHAIPPEPILLEA